MRCSITHVEESRCRKEILWSIGDVGREGICSTADKVDASSDEKVDRCVAVRSFPDVFQTCSQNMMKSFSEATGSNCDAVHGRSRKSLKDNRQSANRQSNRAGICTCDELRSAGTLVSR